MNFKTNTHTLQIKKLFQALQRGQAMKPDEKPSNTLLLFSYLTWTRINKTIDRNMLMVDLYRNALNRQVTMNPQSNTDTSEDKQLKNVKHQDIVRLYDIIIQVKKFFELPPFKINLLLFKYKKNYKDMSNLPGLTTDATYQSDNELQIAYFKAFRTYFISLFYLANKKYGEAVGFCFKCEKYIKEVMSNLEKLSKKSDLNKIKDVYQSDLKKLEKDLNESKYKIQTAALLKDETTETTKDSKESHKDKLEKIVRIFYKYLNLIVLIL